ncbi:MAG TPA: tetratricopeptide repeat protein [Steroidobacteraceae bacterium]|nr:tetratricopeptide repeat protein [Steroidobacteraceae bacterium]
MKKANLVLMAALAAAGLAGVTGGSLLPVSVAVAADKEKPAAKQKLSPEVAKPLMAAQKAMNEKNWDAAAAEIANAQAVEPKTPYDAFMVDELGWYVQLQKKDYARSAEALERGLNSGFVPEADRGQRTKALTQMLLQTKQYPKAIEWGTEYLKTNPSDSEIALQLAQARYLSNDFAGAKAAADQIIASSPTPPEGALLLALRTSYETKDAAGTTRALQGLVRHYPQQKYWEDLLNDQLFRTKDDRGLRALYRLMNDTGTLDKADDYAEMGSTLVTAGFPNEAKQVLERGMSSGVFSGDARSRAQQDLDRAKSGAAVDAKDAPTAGQQLASAKTADQMVGIGKLYFSQGDYQKAVDALQKGLAKGGLKDADDANLLLGIANARLNKPAEAKAAFDAVKNPTLAEVASLWKLKLDVSGAPSAPATAATTPPTTG